ncbi:hypothetical protein [Winogradskyella jejuensis]|uniref:Uncharacterized protein n=1 Tax=Winogradskyella jejuensis TaxID=1089305 RepID=A0A1M5TQ49_9FLAO|nr:hypothetical protein [Winogradskyella jejuensis]SHH52829.1 hypothetical protein SAMN05444148_2237 [Winogradskyella jejuensis]
MFKFKRIKPFSKLSPKQKIFRILKFIGGAVVFITLPTLLFFGFIYLKYNEPLPEAIESPKADLLAHKMLNALDYEAYKNTDYIEWTFKSAHSYKWYKSADSCEVKWKDFTVILQLKNPEKSSVFVSNKKYNGIEKQNLISKAESYFNNDSFWLVAPYKVFDKGTIRKLAKTEDNKEALLVTYTSGGTTPGDSYLWHINEKGMPTSYQMWVDILPISGLKATWNNWKTMSSGANLPTHHKLLFLDLELTNLKGINY